MKKLSVFALSATLLVPAGIAAQTVAPPVPWQDVPAARLNAPARAPMTMAPAAAPAFQRPPVTPMRVRPTMPMTQPMPMRVRPVPRGAPGQLRTREGRIRMHHVGPMGHHRRFPHIGRVSRGFLLSPAWFGPRFHIQNWGLYGFSAPPQDARWIRYYDDALLVDRDGRVLDTRYGVDWDRYGERWGYDSGVPEYLDDDYDYDDFAYADEGDDGYYGDDDDYEDGRYEERGQRACDAPPERDCRIHVYREGGYPWGYPAFSYGYAYGYPITITETTTITEPVVTQHTYYVEEQVAVPARRRAVRHHRARAKPACNCRAPARKPPAPYRGGEKG